MGLPSPDPPECGQGAGTRLGWAEILLNFEFSMCLLLELHFPAVLGVEGIAPGSVEVYRGSVLPRDPVSRSWLALLPIRL